MNEQLLSDVMKYIKKHKLNYVCTIPNPARRKYREYDAKWRLENRTHIIQQRAKNCIEKRIADNVYYQKNKERIKQQVRRYKSLHKEKHFASVRQWQKDNPVKFKTYALRTVQRAIEKQLKISDSFLKNPTKEDRIMRSKFITLTELLYKDILPKQCQLCGSTTKLNIHHKRYNYPILQKDIIRLCQVCHMKIHNQRPVSNPEEAHQRKLYQDRLRRKFKKLLPQYCEACGSTERLHIHHTSYPEIDTLANLKRLCIHCHWKEHGANHTKQEVTV